MRRLQLGVLCVLASCFSEGDSPEETGQSPTSDDSGGTSSPVGTDTSPGPATSDTSSGDEADTTEGPGECMPPRMECDGECVECPEGAAMLACEAGACVATQCEPGLYVAGSECVPFQRVEVGPATESALDAVLAPGGLVVGWLHTAGATRRVLMALVSAMEKPQPEILTATGPGEPWVRLGPGAGTAGVHVAYPGASTGEPVIGYRCWSSAGDCPATAPPSVDSVGNPSEGAAGIVQIDDDVLVGYAASGFGRPLQRARSAAGGDWIISDLSAPGGVHFLPDAPAIFDLDARPTGEIAITGTTVMGEVFAYVGLANQAGLWVAATPPTTTEVTAWAAALDPGGGGLVVAFTTEGSLQVARRGSGRDNWTTEPQIPDIPADAIDIVIDDDGVVTIAFVDPMARPHLLTLDGPDREIAIVDAEVDVDATSLVTTPLGVALAYHVTTPPAVWVALRQD